MAAGLPLPSTQENISTSLSSGITDVSATMTVGDASKIVAPCYLVVDRVDSAGSLKNTSLWEYVKVTNVAGNDLTITRGQSGSTAQSHGAGAVVEAVATAQFFEDWYAALNPEHTATGGHVITGTMTVAGMNLASAATINFGAFTRGEFRSLQASSVASISLPQASVFNRNVKLDQIQYATSTTDINSTSTSYTDFTGLSVTFTPNVASNFLVLVQTTAYNSQANGGTNSFIVDMDGATQGNDPLMVAIQQDGSTGNYNVTTSAFLWITGVSAASHTVKVRAKVSSGTIHTTYGSLTVIPFSS